VKLIVFWLSRNEVVFNRLNSKLCLHVIFRDAFWIRSWYVLSKEEEKKNLKEGSRRLETTSLEAFNKPGWNEEDQQLVVSYFLQREI
jgi:hypothetical protein